jgi:hypothetical protein
MRNPTLIPRPGSDHTPAELAQQRQVYSW